MPGALGAVGALRGFSAAVAQRGLGTPWEDVIIGLSGFDPETIALTKALIARESEWNPRAVNPGDPSYGLMQVLLSTARGYLPGITVEELMDPPTNITAGMAYLGTLQRRYTDRRDIVSSYNAGRPIAGNQRYVDDVLAYMRWYAMNDPLLVGTGVGPAAEESVVELDPVTVTAARWDATAWYVVAGIVGLVLVLD